MEHNEPDRGSENACASHPRQLAVASCSACGRRLCALCSFDLNRRAYCSDCAAQEARAQSAAPPSVPSIFPSPTPPQETSRPAAQCSDHPDNEAVAYCRLCAKPVCATCDFALPGDVHLCPACVETGQSSDEINPKRKRLSYFAIALAAWSTVLFILLLSGALAPFFSDDAAGKAADIVITNLTLWPLLVGFGLSMGAVDRRLRNTITMKVALWWNGVLGALFLLIVIAANLGIIG